MERICRDGVMKRDAPQLFNQCGGDVPHRDIPEQRGQSSGAARGLGLIPPPGGPGSPPHHKKRTNEREKKEKSKKKKRKKEKGRKKDRKSEGVRIERGLQAVP